MYTHMQVYMYFHKKGNSCLMKIVSAVETSNCCFPVGIVRSLDRILLLLLLNHVFLDQRLQYDLLSSVGPRCVFLFVKHITSMVCIHRIESDGKCLPKYSFLQETCDLLFSRSAKNNKNHKQLGTSSSDIVNFTKQK